MNNSTRFANAYSIDPALAFEAFDPDITRALESAPDAESTSETADLLLIFSDESVALFTTKPSPIFTAFQSLPQLALYTIAYPTKWPTTAFARITAAHNLPDLTASFAALSPQMLASVLAFEEAGLTNAESLTALAGDPK